MKLLLLEDDPLLNRELQQLLQHWGLHLRSGNRRQHGDGDG